MNMKNDRPQPGQPRPAETPAPPRRFRIARLEERIAPRGCARGTGNTRRCTRCE